MKSFRTLKDFPQIPSTPPPSEKKEKGLVLLDEELEYERKYLYALCMENKELEEILQELDKEISYVKNNFPQQLTGSKKLHANNEFWLKYESQLEFNRKLEREKKFLENEIRQIEEQGLINLDSLTQSELILYVKQLERTKTNLQSDLRSKEWGLDKQARDIHHLNEVKRALQAEIRHYDKEFSLFRHYKQNSCPSASPTGRRNSFAPEEKRLKFWKPKEKNKSKELEKFGDKQNSLSEEDITTEPKSDLMFSSLDESKLGRMECESPTPGFQRRTIKGEISERKRVVDVKKGPVKKTVAIGCLPELTKSKCKTPSPRNTKTKRVKGESKVGNVSPKSKFEMQNSNKPIKIIVTYETQRTCVTEKTNSEKPSSTVTTTPTTTAARAFEEEKKSSESNKSESFRSADEVYEDDFEGSDLDKQDEKKVGYLTTRV